MKRNLLFYNYISDINDISRLKNFDLKYLKIYADLFTGLRLIYIATNEELSYEKKLEISEEFSFLGNVEVIFVINNSESRESEYFLDQLRYIEEKSDKDSITFYAHNKGSTYNSKNVDRWATAMYMFNLDNLVMEEMERELVINKKIFAGCFRVDHPSPPWVESDWHFSGTFFWFSHELFKIDSWNAHYIDRFSTESYPGMKTDVSRSHNIKGLSNHGCDLRYDHYWDTFFKPHIIGQDMYNRFQEIMELELKELEFKKLISKYGSAWEGHFKFGIDLVKKFSPKVIVDLGVDFGFSMFTLSYNNIGDVYGIDTFTGDDMTGYRNTFDIVNEMIDEHQIKYGINNIHLIKGDFNEIVKEWGRKIDILHIDGMHTYDAVKNDFEKWSNHLSENAIVLFHDVEEFDSVRKFFSEIPGFKILRKGSCGLGIWTKKYDSYQIVEDLLYI